MSCKTTALKLSATVLIGLITSGIAWGYEVQKANSRYVIHGETVYDKKSDLTWQRCSIGQRWKEGIGCVGIVKPYAFDEAQVQGGSEWRVPSKDELSTLIDHRKVDARRRLVIDEEVFPDMDENHLWYWSSTPGSSGGWAVNFADGNVDDGFVYRKHNDGFAVRLVRGGQ